MLVAFGIMLSRVTGLIRVRVIAHYFGLQSDAADAFYSAFRIPNFLQTLLGEGAMSASFIPVYASLLAQGKRKEADRVAGAVAALLFLVVALFVLAGVFAAPLLSAVLAPGFKDGKRELTTRIIRIVFPGTGVLVMGAWCLGVLNSHRKFLLPYAAGVMMNVAMIATLVVYGRSTTLPRLAIYLAWGSVAGSILQLGVQIPAVLRLASGLKFKIDPGSVHVRSICRNFVPVFISRGVVQVSAWIDSILASLLPTGAVTGLASAQLLYTLPISLFGMSVSAAELPAMSGAAALDTEGIEVVRRRLNAGLRQIAFFVVPSSMAFLALGDVLASALLESGRFSHADSMYVWGILAGSSIGLLASTLARLYSSSYFALRDTRTPLRYALVRVTLTSALGYVCAVHLPGWLGISRSWGAAGLTGSAGVAGWVEMFLLRRTLSQRIGGTTVSPVFILRLWSAAVAGAAVAWLIKLSLPALNPIMRAALVLAPYGLVYLGAAWALQIPEAAATLNRLVRRK